MKNFVKREKLFLLIFGLGVIIFLWDLLLLKKIFIHGDYKEQFFPWFMEYAKAVKHFTLPYWAPNMACGFPLVAEGQIGAFYPINLLMFFLLPPMVAYSYGVALHFMLGGIFMYIFCRKIGLEGLAAIVPAILFMFASPYAGCFSNIASLKVLCWFPLTLYIICLSFEKNKPHILIFSGVVMGIQLLAGAPQMAFYSIAFSALYFIFLVARAKGIGRANYFLAFFVSFIIALVVCLPQLLEARTLIDLSNRSTRDISFAVARSFFPAGILTLVFPSTMAAFDGMMYIGILPLAFSIFAIFYSKKNKHYYFLITLFVISLFCAFGRYNPLYTAFLKIIKFYLFRIPSKFLFFSAFSLIVLSGMGLQEVLKSADERRRNGLNIISLAVLIFSTLSLLLINIFLRVWKDGILSFAKGYLVNHFYNPALHRYPIQHYMDKLQSLYQNTLGIISFSDTHICIQLLLLIVSVILVAIYAKKIIRRDIFNGLFVGIVLVDLIFFSSIGPGFRGNLMEYSDAVKNTEEIEFLKKDKSLYRVYQFQMDGPGDMLKPNMNMYFGVDNIGVYSPLVFKRYMDLLGPLGCVDDSTGYSETSKDELYKSIRLLGMLNVKYIITDKEIASKDLELVYETGNGVKVFLNKMALPRAFIVSKIEAIENDDEILSFMKGDKFDPSEIAVTEGLHDRAGVMSGSSDGAYAANVEKYTENTVLIRTRSGAPGLLVLSDYYYPGWRCYLDGKAVDILRVNYILRGVYLPKGDHEVRFEYKK